MDWKQETRERFSKAKDADKWLNIYKTLSPNVEAVTFRKRRDYTVKKILENLREGGKVLDLGCGAGPVLRELQEAGISCLGIDYSGDMLRLAKENLGEYNDTPLIQAECEQIPLADESIDGIVCLGVISYTESIDKAMVELQRILKSGGIAIVSYRNQYNEILLDPVKCTTAVLGKMQCWFSKDPQVRKEIGRALNPASVLASAQASGLTLVDRQQLGFGAIRFNGKVISDGKMAHRFNKVMENFFKLLPFRWLHEISTDVHILILRKSIG